MTRLLATCLAIFSLAGCATQEFGWSPHEAGCSNRGLGEALLVPDTSDLRRSDIRIGRLPDTGRGPGFMVQFARHRGGPFGEDGTPQLVLAVGDRERTCVEIVEEASCPVAARVYEDLSTLSLPVGFKFSDPSGITVLHGTQYFLASVDGEGNPLYWSYYGPGHPAQRALSSALDALLACAHVLRSTFDANGT
ncbi:MAG: hypothetical protein EA353_12455 [Puniceicoccaceae bacterium]|nr:MAG: hypothetical protein EA353_12455 [Puniceicoccaceae bacterium]